MVGFLALGPLVWPLRPANTACPPLRARARRRGVWLAMSLFALCLAAPAGAGEEWSVQATPGVGAGAKPRCLLESERHSLPDGYQTTWAQIEVDDHAVRVHSASVLDPGDRDIGLVVDEGEFVHPDEVTGQKTAVFAAQYQKLIDEFKRGLRVKVQLRFWPTWPKTTTYSTTFSLIGFTSAYARMSDCQTP